MNMELIECAEKRDKEDGERMETASAGDVWKQAENYSWAMD